MHKYRIKKADLEINLAPLIDVVFLLLIFFMVASTLHTNEIQATIQLPQVDMQTETERHPMILYLDKSGRVSIDNDFISWDRLPGYLKEKPKEKLEGIEVYADKEVHFEYITRVMAVASKVKIEKIIFCLEHNTSE